MIDQAVVAERFEREFGCAGQLSWVPGRVNLIGDHVDYCGGAVLPMPVQCGTTVAVRATTRGVVRCVSANMTNARVEVRCAEPAALPSGSWGRFVAGAVGVLSGAGIHIAGADVVVAGDIPGSGLSSSASLSVALLFGLARSAERELEGVALALAAQRIEHDYVGVQCGLMDQAAVVLSRADCALWFDCLDYHHRSIPVDATIEIVVADTGRVRRLVDSQYNARLEETARAAAQLGTERARLARFGLAAFEERAAGIDDPIAYRRARHVVGEAARVAQAVDALAARDWPLLGRLFDASHVSLRDDFAVSCDELDLLAALLRDEPGCYGARMTGAGFGGNVVALFDRGRGAAALVAIADRYRARCGAVPTGFVARSLGGVRSIDG
ncbi:MAG TPA: galactokinase [Pseudomonadales bacterium]|nr:galactokinase [Pseudomonadales bacterium]